MLPITNLVGETDLLTNVKGLTRKRAVNGDKTLTFLVIPDESNEHCYCSVDTESIVEFDGEEYVIKDVTEKNKGLKSVKQVEAVHKFFNDMLNIFQYKIHNGSMTFHDALTFVFENTPYTFNILDQFYAQEFDNLGRDNRLSLFQKIIERYSAEFQIDGNTVFLKREIGNKIGFQYRYGYNIKTIDKKISSKNLATIIKGFGGTPDDNGVYPIQETYTSTNVSKLGELEASAVYDERITTVEGMQERLKKELVDEPELSLSIDIVDLRASGEDYDVVSEGDYGYIIYEPMNDLDIEARVVEIEEEFDYNLQPIKTSVTLSNLREGTTDVITRLNQTSKTVNRIMNGQESLPFSALDEEVKQSTKAILSAQTEVIFSNGIIARSKTDPNDLLVIKNNGIGLSLDGGQTFETAIDAKGVYSERLIGKIIAGETLTIENLGKTFRVDGDGVTIDGGSISITNGIPDNQIRSASKWNGHGTYIDDEGIYTGKILAEQITAGTLTKTYSKRIDIRNGEIESYYNDNLTMKFGQYSLDFYHDDASMTGSFRRGNIANSALDGLVLEVNKDFFDITHKVDSESLRQPSFRTSMSEKHTSIMGAYSTNGSRLGMYANSRLWGNNRFDLPSIELIENSSENSIYSYFGGATNRSSNSIYSLRFRSGSSSFSTTIEATKDKVSLQSTTFEVNRFDSTRSRYDFYVGSNDISIKPFTNAVRWSYDANNCIRQFDSGQVEFLVNGTAKHLFFADGTKSGGSIEIDGQNLGMSPIDSPQILIEYIEFDIPLSLLGTKVYLDETYLKAVDNFAIFPNNGKILEKGTNYFIISGTGKADCRIVGERTGYKDSFWSDTDISKEVGELDERVEEETTTN